MVLSAVDLDGSPHVGVRWLDRPKWSSQLPLMAPHFQGRSDPRHTSRQGRIRKSVELRIRNHAADGLQRNGMLVFHMAWRIWISE